MEEEKDEQEQQPLEESTEESGEESGESTDLESEETEEDSNTKKAYDLARDVQRGYTTTRQDLSELRKGQDALKTALEDLNRSKGEQEPYDEDEPLTMKTFLKLQEKGRLEASRNKEKIVREETAINNLIDSQLDDLRVLGKVRTKADEDKLIKFAVARKISDLSTAFGVMEEIDEARRDGVKAKAKSKVKKEAGSQIGTSAKAGNKEQGGVVYSQIVGKTLDEIASGE